MQELYHAFLDCAGAFTDTRSILPNGMFFALKGESFNGNGYAAQALAAGARYAVVDDPAFHTPGKTFLVANVLETLQNIAAYHRKQLGTPIVSLTGSNGKTTTKEIMHAILATKFKSLATIGNLNNHIGVPLTLLRLQQHHEFAIVEMGANHQNEIAQLAKIAQPNCGLITNYGLAHLEGFGGVAGVIKGKTELFQFLQNNGLALVNADDPIQMEKSNGQLRKTYGANGDLKISQTMVDGYAAILIGGVLMVSKLPGEFNSQNLVAAAAVGLLYDVPLQQIQSAIAAYAPNMNRSEWRTTPNNTLLLDAYNANPSSMQAAIESFGDGASNRWAILGDMFELGAEAFLLHQQIVDLANSRFDGQVIFVGNNFLQHQGAPGVFLPSTAALLLYLEQHPLRQKLILLKGSRGMQLENAVPLL